MNTTDVIDRVLEAAVVPSFTRIGYDVRSRTEDWTPLSDYRLDGRVIVITGATSGLGKAAATALARCGADVVIVGRDASKTADVSDEVATHSDSNTVSTVIADLSDLGSVRAAADVMLERYERLDVLIHNAGAMFAERQTTSDGNEATVAVHVVGPFLLTSLLLDRLRRSTPSRVLTMSSGGMLTAPLAVDDLEMTPDRYKGADQYARAKRAQVTLNEMWADLLADRSVVFHAAHPGWADTPGVAESLPTFRKLTGPLLRSPDQGADTIAWLAADDDQPLDASGYFWHDRRIRPIHRLSSTRRSDTRERRRQLWSWCVERSGVDPGHDR